MPGLFYDAASLVILLAGVLVSRVAGGLSAANLLRLEKVSSHGVEFGELLKRDRARHARFLQGTIVDFPVDGSADPFTVGLYYTRVKLGSPPREFYVQIDTGSDILWVTCNPCNGCPKSSGLNIKLESFDPDQSSTASLISCADNRCASVLQTAEGECSSHSQNSQQCYYSFQYGDGSSASGYYVSDTLYFDTIVGEDSIANSSASSVVFGCSNVLSKGLTKPDRAVDGIFGFGQHDLSVISQLSSKGISSKVFSHCLEGSDNGGGILVLGEIVEPGIVYTPLVQSQPHYNLNLHSIAVNGKTLPIDPAVFATSNTRGTIIDSGTTLAYLAEEAYDPFVNAVTAAVSQSVHSFLSKGNPCFLITNSVDEIFPSVSLTFQGGAIMMLKPQDYLLQQGYVNSAMIWCIGWQKIQGQGTTILGDLVLKDKIFVYDLGGQQIGWKNYDCSQSVNVTSASGKSEYVDAGQLSESSSSHDAYGMIPRGIAGFLVHSFAFSIYFSQH